MISSCRRKKGSGNDSALYDIEWNVDLHQFIKENHFEKIYFTSKQVHRWYIKKIGRVDGLEEIILLSPSANGVRFLPRLREYQDWEKTVVLNKKPTVFRELFYKKTFF